MEARGGTDVQIVRYGERGERQTEPSHSWFPPQFPTGELELNSYRSKAKDFRNLERVVLDLFSN